MPRKGETMLSRKQIQEAKRGVQGILANAPIDLIEPCLDIVEAVHVCHIIHHLCGGSRQAASQWHGVKHTKNTYFAQQYGFGLETRPSTHDDAVRSTVVAACDRAEPFLPRRVPLRRVGGDVGHEKGLHAAFVLSVLSDATTHNLQLDDFSIQLHCSNFLQRRDSRVPINEWGSPAVHCSCQAVC